MTRAPFLAPAHDTLRARLREHVARRIRPHARRWEAAGRCPRSAVRAFAQAGFVSLDPCHNAVVAEEVPRGECLGLALSLFVQANLIGPLLSRLGTRRQQEEHLAPLLRGERMGALAVSEPTAGSDVAALACRARAVGTGYVLDGVKTYITNAACADFLIVAARVGERSGLDGLSLFLVPARTRGVRVEPLATLGLNTSSPGTIELSGCVVPRAARLGAEGAAFGYVQEGLNRERLFGGLAAVAWGAYALERTRAWARSRRAFGRTLASFQAVRHQFADRAIDLEAARQLNYATFARWAAGEPVTKEICMIKVFSYSAAQRAIETCLQLHGGAGYLHDHWVSRFYRDARALTIAAGTPEVMKDMVAAHLRL